jgi:beta-lactamase class A
MTEKTRDNLDKLKNPFVIIFAVIFLLFGIVLGMYLNSSKGELDLSEQVRLGSGVFTNPLLECEVAKSAVNSPKVYFDAELKLFVKDIQKKNKLSSISLYYRDMNNGPVIGINDDEFFMPASLLKVPVMISYFKHAESDPSILSKKILFTKEMALKLSPEVPPEKSVELNHEYTTEDLIERMIVYSDNQALALLWPNISMDEYISLYKALGVDTEAITDPDHGISVKEYSRFFRILYNSSFVSQTYSERALKTLSESKFHNGIRKYIPNNVRVSGKFGERGLANGTRQFHDCGIIYYPMHPYLLCVMTRGNDSKKLADSISQISKFVFTKIDNQYSTPNPIKP